MPSSFGWIDFAEEDRRRMLDVVKMFQEEQETRDELGVGTIRDAFSEYFFPGTSTIQTRARYMLFIPWIYLRLEKQRLSGVEMERRARSDEVRLIYALLKSSDTEGVIGKESKERLQRLPSLVYWTGLYSWKIRLFPGTRSEYHQYLEMYYRKKKHLLKTDDNEPAGSFVYNWDPNLPDPPDGLLRNAELSLTRDEAVYLRERVMSEHRTSLLAHFLYAGSLEETDFLWEQSLVSTLPVSLKQAIKHAQNFSEVIYGAAVLYNLMLARKSKRLELVEQYEGQMAVWAADMRERLEELENWYEQINEFWALSFLKQGIPPLTKDFVNGWLRLVFEGGSITAIGQDKTAQNLIYHRELALKGTRARLENSRALDAWTGAAGDYQLGYRWGNVKKIIADILAGLGRR